jgi:hypothetical protein
MPTSRDFRGSRFAIAQALLPGSKTASAIGVALDKPTGSIFGLLRRMVGEGLLVADTDTPERGTRYLLAPAARETVTAMEREPVAPGTISPGQHLLLVEQPSGSAGVQRVLAQDSLADLVSWATEIAGGWLLAFDGESSFPVQRLRIALEAVGATARELSIDGVLSGVELRDRAAWLVEDFDRATLDGPIDGRG